MKAAVGTLAFTVALCVSAWAPAHPQAGAETGSLVGVVSMSDGGLPLPSASVEIVGTAKSRLTGPTGRFRFDSLPVGPTRLRVRHIGYTPVDLTVTVGPAINDTVRVSLPRIVIRLATVRVTAQTYCGRAWTASRGDSNVVRILDQLIENADRNRSLVRDNPFRYDMAREFAELTSKGRDTTARVTHRDTVHRQSTRAWRYAPGEIIDTIGGTEILNLLELSDIADGPFLDNHCWRYRGVEKLDGERFVRLDFEPATNIKQVDVSGSVFLDTATFQIQRTIVRLDRMVDPESFATLSARGSSPKPTGRQRLQVETWFREIVPGIPAFDRIVSINDIPYTRPPCRQVPGRTIMKIDPVTRDVTYTPTYTTECPPASQVLTRETHQLLSVSTPKDSTSRR